MTLLLLIFYQLTIAAGYILANYLGLTITAADLSCPSTDEFVAFPIVKGHICIERAANTAHPAVITGPWSAICVLFAADIGPWSSILVLLVLICRAIYGYRATFVCANVVFVLSIVHISLACDRKQTERGANIGYRPGSGCLVM